MNESTLTTEPERIRPGIGVEAIAALDVEGRRLEGVLCPQIYVASLSDYNAGRLHGKWIDATQDVADLDADIQHMLERSPAPNAEEWAIHDYEEFGAVRLSEYEDLKHVSRIAQGLEVHGAAFGHWVNYCREQGAMDQLERFTESYLGVWGSIEDYGAQVIDDLGLEEQLDQALPGSLRSYVSIDVRQFGSDLAMDLWTVTDDRGVHLFDTR